MNAVPMPEKYAGLTLEAAIALANKVALRTGVRQRVSVCKYDLCKDTPLHFSVRPVDYDLQQEWA